MNKIVLTMLMALMLIPLALAVSWAPHMPPPETTGVSSEPALGLALVHGVYQVGKAVFFPVLFVVVTTCGLAAFVKHNEQNSQHISALKELEEAEKPEKPKSRAERRILSLPGRVRLKGLSMVGPGLNHRRVVLLKRYADEAHAKGVQKAQIRFNLEEAGWQKPYVDAALA